MVADHNQMALATCSVLCHKFAVQLGNSAQLEPIRPYPAEEIVRLTDILVIDLQPHQLGGVGQHKVVRASVPFRRECVVDGFCALVRYKAGEGVLSQSDT